MSEIINETQTGFMPKRHISCNIRLILDLIDYAHHINSDAIILFLDFYKAFDTIEHKFLFLTLELFGFGEHFIKFVKMIYKDINSSVLLQFDTSNRFPISRGVRQGCGISPFLFVLVVELLSLSIRNNPDIKGVSIFDREIKISQLADDTTLFLENTNQVGKALETINAFSEASGLNLNIPKCEILCLFDSLETSLNNIPIKDNVKYLGIHISKKISLRQDMNFLPKIKKAKIIFNNWLQRDLSFLGRVLLIKAEGLARFIYPSFHYLSMRIPVNRLIVYYLSFFGKTNISI